eukprot:jgi/Bigna1/137107/aug1.37_g11815
MPCSGPRPKFDVECGNNEVRVNDDWRMKIVHLGHPGLRNVERVAMKTKDGKHQLLHLAVPDLPFEHWHEVLGDLDAESWHGHEPEDEGEFWASDKGDDVGEESVTWWLVKFRKRQRSKGTRKEGRSNVTCGRCSACHCAGTSHVRQQRGCRGCGTWTT